MGAAASSPQSAATSAASSSSSACPVLPPASASSTSQPSVECPVPASQRQSPIYDVYSQRVDNVQLPPEVEAVKRFQRSLLLDPVNNMPVEPNQMPYPGQRLPISTCRQPSTIPKGGTEDTWLYPSPQMFYNALKRKGKGDDVTEEHMEAVVWAHNTMNERTWRQVLAWETLHQQGVDSPAAPKLLRFEGKPHIMSPLARMKALMGGPEPFDRHDWYVDRDGEVVRYVIDFYHEEDKAGTPEAFDITVRPALDSIDSALDRVKMSIYLQCAAWGLPCPITGKAGDTGRMMQAATSSE